MVQFMNNEVNVRGQPQQWKYESPTTPGLHLVVSPNNSACKVTWVYRLNLQKGEAHQLHNPDLELNGGIIEGEVELVHCDKSFSLGKFDSFYLPGNMPLRIEARAATVIYIGGGPWENRGDFFVRSYDPYLPWGEIHQLHGTPPYEREIFMTLNQEVPASRMISGFTWGDFGKWTSWPPHQHSADLEEVYCYFDLTPPEFAFHLSSRKAGIIEAVHPVSTGDFVVIPEGYHPTFATPGTRSQYFWIMVAHRRSSRSYDLAKSDFGSF